MKTAHSGDGTWELGRLHCAAGAAGGCDCGLSCSDGNDDDVDDDVYYYIGERLNLEGETENMGVCARLC